MYSTLPSYATDLLQYQQRSSRKSTPMSMLIKMLKQREIQKIVLILVLLSVVSLIIMISGFEIFVDEEKYFIKPEPKLPRDPVWTLSDKPQDLLNLSNFTFIHQVADSVVCKVLPSAPKLLLVMVSSSRYNFMKRNLIRRTWGSLLRFQYTNVRIVFLLLNQTVTEEAEVKQKILDEIQMYDDIIMGSIQEVQRNEVYRTLMGYKWALNFCREADFIIKTYDDIYIDLFQVVERLSFIRPSNLMLCHVQWGEIVNRFPQEERYVAENEFSDYIFPAHCSPSSTIISFDLAEKVYLVSKTVEFLWLEDVFLTGILQRKINFNFMDIGFKYQYDKNASLKWARNGDYGVGQKLPWMFINLNTFRVIDIYDLWRKIFSVYQKIFDSDDIVLSFNHKFYP